METEKKTVTVEVIREAVGLVSAAVQKMPGLADLDKEQKALRPNVPVSASDLRIFRDRVAEALRCRDELPSTFDLPTLELEAGRIIALADLLSALGVFSDRVKDTLWLLSGPTLQSAATANAHLKLASKLRQQTRQTDRRRKRRASSATASPVQVQPATVAPPVDPAKHAA